MVRNQVLWVLVVAYFAAFLLLGLAVLAAVLQDVPVGDLTRDPALILGGHPLTGMLSNFGVLLWRATATSCLLSALVLHRRGDTDSVLFLGAAGLLTGLLMIDDLFMLHDWLLPVYLGIPEPLVYAVYVVLALAYLVCFRRRLRAARTWLLLTAILFFVLSVGSDLVLPDGPGIYLWEDGTKFLGIISWTLFHIDGCLAALSAASPARIAGTVTDTPADNLTASDKVAARPLSARAPARV